MNIPTATELTLFDEVVARLREATKVALRMGMSRAELQGIQWKLAVEVQEEIAGELLKEVREGPDTSTEKDTEAPPRAAKGSA